MAVFSPGRPPFARALKILGSIETSDGDLFDPVVKPKKGWWFICDEDRIIRADVNLSALLESVGEADREKYAVAFVKEGEMPPWERFPTAEAIPPISQGPAGEFLGVIEEKAFVDTAG
jgi:hypothetical protein